MADRLQEAFRLVFETSGQQGIDALKRALQDLGAEGTEAGIDVAKAIDQITQNSEDLERVSAFNKLKLQLVETEAQLKKAQAGAQALFRTFSADDTSNSRIRKLQDDARKSVNELSTAATRQREQLQRVRAELDKSGISTRNLGTAQGELRKRMDEAQGNLRRTVTNLQAYRRESQQAAKDIPATNERIADSYGKVGGALNRLRSLAAPVLAFLSFEGARRGIANLVQVARAAEDARRSLGEMYGDAQVGNRVYAEIEKLAKRNGLALDATVAAAQRLKAFGLDPLNGSLQALVDRNAAAGGSMETLEGTILAIGQAWAKQKLQGEEILQLVERGVPVWDLLQKSTGKNVQELQKLSEQGKLGRDVIAGLIAEIGRANDGAAARSMNGLSGLIAQASARWLEFRQKIVDAGVGEYLQKQLKLIVDSTGGMDALAKRISDGIVSTLEALKRLGTTLAPIGAIVRDVSLALAEHARQVVFLGKCYAVLKLGQLATQFSVLTRAQLANAAAATAAGNAAAGSATRFGLLDTAIGKLPKMLRIGVAVVGVDWAIQQFRQLEQAILDKQDAMQAQLRFDIGQRELQREQLAMGLQLQQLYRANADTAIKSTSDLSALNREQAETYKFALEQARLYYAGVIREARATGDAQAEATGSEHWKALGAAIDAVGQHISDLGAKAAQENRIRLPAIQAVEAFDVLIAKGETVRKAVDGLFKGIDWTSDDGLAKAADILSQMEVRGAAVAKVVREELAGELKKLAAEDLANVEAAAVKAFGAGSEAAKAMADAVDRARFDKLGVDLEAIRSGFTKAGKEVTTAFADMVREIDDLGLTAQQKSAAIAQAFDNAFKQASTKAELQALKASLQEALSSGDLGFVEFQQRIAETDARLLALSDTGRKLGSGIEQGAQAAGSALEGVARSAERAASSTSRSGDAAAAAGAKSAEAAEKTEKFQFALGAMSDEAIRSLAALNKYAGSPLWAQMWNRQMAQFGEQYAAISGINEQLDEQLARFDPITEKLEELKRQYQFVDDATLRGVAQKQLQMEQQVERRREDARRLREEADAAARAAAEAREREVDARTLADPVNDTLTLEWVPPSKSVATAANAAEMEQAERIANLVAPLVLAKIQRSQSLSLRRSNIRSGR